MSEARSASKDEAAKSSDRLDSDVASSDGIAMPLLTSASASSGIAPPASSRISASCGVDSPILTVIAPLGASLDSRTATTLALDPLLLLLDEPTAGMTHEDIDRVVALIRTVRAGRTILMVEQKVTEVLKIVDKGYVLQRGRIPGAMEEGGGDGHIAELGQAAANIADIFMHPENLGHDNNHRIWPILQGRFGNIGR